MDTSLNQLKIAKKIKEIQNNLRKKNQKLQANRALFEEKKIKPFVEALVNTKFIVEKPSEKIKKNIVLKETPVKYEKNLKEEYMQNRKINPHNEKENVDLYMSVDEDEDEQKTLKDKKRKADETILAYSPMRSKDEKKPRYEKASRFEEDDEELFEDIIPIQEQEEDEGQLTKEYIKKLYNEKNHDISRGPHFDGNILMLGNKTLKFDKNDNIIVGNETFSGTRGLFELIFMTNPSNYSNEDLKNYKKILILSSAHLVENSPTRRMKGSTGHKYLNIIYPLFKQQLGAGVYKSVRDKIPDYELMESKIKFVHYTDPNVLINRLRLLKASEQAGNSSHKSEIKAILKQLQKTGFL